MNTHTPWHEIHHPAVCFVSLSHDVGGVGSCCEGSWPPVRFHTGSSVVKAMRDQGMCLSVGRADIKKRTTVLFSWQNPELM